MARWRSRNRAVLPRSVVVCAILLLGFAPALADDAGPPGLQFSRHGLPVAAQTIEALAKIVAPRSVGVFDPYEESEIHFEGFPFEAVLDAVYSPSWRDEEEILFTCRDGYQPTLPVARILAHDAWLAFDRRDQADFSIQKFESGARRRIDLAPFYLVWENLDNDEVRGEGDYGWPYQLTGIELIRASDRFPKMVPPEGSPPDAVAGFSAFRVHCSRCHAINGEGGTIGPDLNVPVNPVHVRDVEWLRRWIDNPSEILPTARMPRLNPALPARSETIGQLIRYLEAMAETRGEADDAAGSRAEPGRFAAFYASFLQHPVLLWIAALAAMAFCLGRRGISHDVRRFCTALGLLSLCDAWLTSHHIVGLGSLPASLAGVVPLCFVLLGDFRFFLLLATATRDGRLEFRAKAIAAAAGLTVVVPLFTQLALAALPEGANAPRVMFLVYEAAFVCLTLGVIRWHPRLRTNPWLLSVSRFVVLYYALWASADAVILFAGQDLGYLLRVVPNLLYYGGLIAVIGGFAPRTDRLTDG